MVHADIQECCAASRARGVTVLGRSVVLAVKAADASSKVTTDSTAPHGGSCFGVAVQGLHVMIPVMSWGLFWALYVCNGFASVADAVVHWESQLGLLVKCGTLVHQGISASWLGRCQSASMLDDPAGFQAHVPGTHV